MTTQDLNNKYNEFKNRVISLGRIDYDHAYAYQCVDLIKAYLDQEFGIKAGSWGDAIKYWTNTNEALNGAFTRVSSNDTQRGDIVVFRTAGKSDNSGSGHIGIAESQDATNVTVLEQNGSTGSGNGQGGNAIRTRAIPRSRIAGIIRPKTSNPTPAPSSGKRLYFNPIGQTATFYPVKGGTFAMKIKDSSYNWHVIEDQGYRVRVNSASAGGDCWVYIIWQTGDKKGQRIAGRYVK